MSEVALNGFPVFVVVSSVPVRHFIWEHLNQPNIFLLDLGQKWPICWCDYLQHKGADETVDIFVCSMKISNTVTRWLIAIDCNCDLSLFFCHTVSVQLWLFLVHIVYIKFSLNSVGVFTFTLIINPLLDLISDILLKFISLLLVCIS